MKNFSTHKLLFCNANSMDYIKDKSIQLVITSPPYPMIHMWDEIFSNQNKQIKTAFNLEDGNKAFELIHKELDKVWDELNRVVVSGGIVCINIGDATRSIKNKFSLFANHSRIINYFTSIGFDNLPNIIWRKKTNSPTKFMGSGMMPSNAYVTLEHEWILIFRKGLKREFKNKKEKNVRLESSYFWEERNLWFSDLWEILGTKQVLLNKKVRERSAEYPFEIPFRLINMFSIKGDTILDPFLGTGTTTLAAITTERNSIGVEIDKTLKEIIIKKILKSNHLELNEILEKRIKKHLNFLKKRKEKLKYFNENHNFEVMTKSEENIKFHFINNIKHLEKEDLIKVDYSDIQNKELCKLF